jgi:hypothetical protein
MKAAPAPAAAGRTRGASAAADTAGPPAPHLAAAIIAACAAMLLLRSLSALTTTNWLWGLNTLRYWEPWLAAVMVLVAALGLVPAVARPIESLLGRWGEAWTRRPAAGDAIAAATMAAATWLLRDPVRFTGDFDLRVGSIGTALDLGRLFPQAFPLDDLLHLRFARWLVGLGVPAADALQGIGAAMAFLFVLGAARFARGLGCRGAALALLLVSWQQLVTLQPLLPSWVEMMELV